MDYIVIEENIYNEMGMINLFNKARKLEKEYPVVKNIIINMIGGCNLKEILVSNIENLKNQASQKNLKVNFITSNLECISKLPAHVNTIINPIYEIHSLDINNKEFVEAFIEICNEKLIEPIITIQINSIEDYIKAIEEYENFTRHFSGMNLNILFDFKYYSNKLVKLILEDIKYVNFTLKFKGYSNNEMIKIIKMNID